MKNRNSNTVREIGNRNDRDKRHVRVKNTMGFRANGLGSRVARITIALVAIGLPLLSIPYTLYPIPSHAASISEGYPSGDSLPLGAMVSISQTEPITVELADINNNSYLTGVVAGENDSLLNINRNGTTTYVAVSGDTSVFVSDINGPITAGDFVGSSWISGVAMRSDTSSKQRLLGVALEDFSADSQDKREFEDIETPSGTQDALVGKIAVRLFDRDIGADPTSQSGLEVLAQRIAGKDVAYARVLMASGLFALSVLVSGIFLSNAIRGSFISLGRNPLASSTIFSSLLQVSGTSIALVIIGAFLAYVVLIL